MDKPHVYYYKNEVGIEYVYCKDSRLSYSEHNHVSVYVVIMLLSGEILLKKKNIDHTVLPNTYFIIKPYETHSISLKSNFYNMISICINKKLVDYYSIEKIKSIIKNDLEYIIEKKLINYEHRILLLNAIEKIYLIDRNELIEQDVNSLACRIQDNPGEEFNISHMSEEIHISKYHLIRKFKKEVGLTPHKFQIQNRIRKAQHLLNRNSSIIEVALETGFYDQSHFIRHFKNIMRITPTDYKKSYIKLANKKIDT